MEELKNYCKNRKLITIICDNCGSEFQKPESEYKRNVKLGRKNFCCRSCAATYSNQHRSKDSFSSNIAKYAGNQKDEYTPFRYTMRCVRRRDKEIDIDLEYLKHVWEEQKGICPYTGLSLVLPTDSNIKTIHPTIRASLDRIDSSKGYVRGNVQFISTSINYLKSDMSDLETKRFLKQISFFTSTFAEDKTISSSSINEEQDAQAGN